MLTIFGAALAGAAVGIAIVGAASFSGLSKWFRKRLSGRL